MERRGRPNSPKAKTDDALSPSAPMPDRKYKLGSQFPADRPRLFFRLAMGRPESSRLLALHGFRDGSPKIGGHAGKPPPP